MAARKVASKRKAVRRGVTLAKLRKLALALPEVEEGTSYGTLAFRVKGKLFARLREDDASLVVRVGFEEREILMQTDPETFYITDHYRDHAMLLVRLRRVHAGELADLLEDSWRSVAPKRLLAAFAAGDTVTG